MPANQTTAQGTGSRLRYGGDSHNRSPVVGAADGGKSGHLRAAVDYSRAVPSARVPASPPQVPAGAPPPLPASSRSSGPSLYSSSAARAGYGGTTQQQQNRPSQSQLYHQPTTNSRPSGATSTSQRDSQNLNPRSFTNPSSQTRVLPPTAQVASSRGRSVRGEQSGDLPLRPLAGSYDKYAGSGLTAGDGSRPTQQGPHHKPAWEAATRHAYYAKKFSPERSPRQRSRNEVQQPRLPYQGTSSLMGGERPPRQLAADLVRTDRARTSVALTRLPSHHPPRTPPNGIEVPAAAEKIGGRGAGSVGSDTASLKGRKRPFSRITVDGGGEPPPAPVAQELAPRSSASPLMLDAVPKLSGDGQAVSTRPVTVELSFGLLGQDQADVVGGHPRDLSFDLRQVLELRAKTAQMWDTTGMVNGGSTKRRKLKGGWQEACSMKSEVTPTARRSALAASFQHVLARTVLRSGSSPLPGDAGSGRTIDEAPKAIVTMPLAAVHLLKMSNPQNQYSDGGRRRDQPIITWPGPVKCSASVRSTFWDVLLPPKPDDEILASPPTESPLTFANRLWSPGCRFLVVWGFEGSTFTYKSNTAHVDSVIDHVRSASAYVQSFGPPKGYCTVHGVGSLDRRERPVPLRSSGAPPPTNTFGVAGLLSSNAKDSANTSSSVDVTAAYRSLFSMHLHQDLKSGDLHWKSNRLFPTSSTTRSQVIKRAASDPVLTAIVEFEYEDQARNFFVANTYSTLADGWCCRIWSMPDFSGIKFWLHYTSLSCQMVDSETPDPDAYFYAPFLSDDDINKLLPGLSVRNVPHRLTGVEIPSSSFGLFQLPALTREVPKTPVVSGTVSKPQRYAKGSLLAPAMAAAWAVANLGAAESSWTNVVWSKIPKYITKNWSDAVDQAEPALAVPRKKAALDSTEGEAAVASDNPPCTPKNIPKRSYVARIAMMMWPKVDGEMLLSPVICSSFEDFVHCKHPAVQQVLPTQQAAAPPAKVVLTNSPSPTVVASPVAADAPRAPSPARAVRAPPPTRAKKTPPTAAAATTKKETPAATKLNGEEAVPPPLVSRTKRPAVDTSPPLPRKGPRTRGGTAATKQQRPSIQKIGGEDNEQS